MSQWISVAERLPAKELDGHAVIVSVTHFRRGTISETDVWLKDIPGSPGRFDFWRDKVTHWMPLPEPPK